MSEDVILDLDKWFRYMKWQKRMLDFDRRFGIHSGIPPCCVEFWCSHPNIRDFFAINEDRDAKYGKAHMQQWHYVPCEDCLTRGHVVKVHLCRRDNPLCQPYLKERAELCA